MAIKSYADHLDLRDVWKVLCAEKYFDGIELILSVFVVMVCALHTEILKCSGDISLKRKEEILESMSKPLSSKCRLPKITLSVARNKTLRS